ncbi:MAG TPA: glycosyltransferase family 39 protein, partial [Bacteroidia bacterium]|nr:glycosyltransferase family 39 protein [Bacteroidia bacterium]
MKYWFLILLSVLLVFRCFYLDQDAPPLQLSNILQEDEPYYCNGAMNMYCASEGRSVPGFEKTKSECFDIDTRLPVFLSLKIFGNNYWGLRIPFLVASLLVMWLMYSIFKLIRPLLNFDLLLLLVMATNFYLFLFSRHANPQIFSILGIVFVIWLFVKYGHQKPVNVILLGFFAAFAPIFIYALNFFCLAGFGIYITIKAIKEKRYSLIFYFATGAVICFLFYILCLYAIGNSPGIVRSILSNGDNDMGTDFSSIKGLLYNAYKDLVAFTNTGFFRYQLLLLFAFMACLPFLFKGISTLKGKEKDLSLLISLLFVFQLIQSFFVLNHSTK